MFPDRRTISTAYIIFNNNPNVAKQYNAYKFWSVLNNLARQKQTSNNESTGSVFFPFLYIHE